MEKTSIKNDNQKIEKDKENEHKPQQTEKELSETDLDDVTGGSSPSKGPIFK